tara:strand:+ start:208 stop:441 length:234 start_codon:yes stop_codon:yes gene_type:complete
METPIDDTKKITISQDTWIFLYSELAAYILEYASLDPVTFVDTDGTERYTEDKQDQFCEIADDVESIMGTVFIKEEQ